MAATIVPSLDGDRKRRLDRPKVVLGDLPPEALAVIPPALSASALPKEEQDRIASAVKDIDIHDPILPTGETILALHCGENGDPDVVRSLLKFGVDPNVRFFSTELHSKYIQFVVGANPLPNYEDPRFQTSALIRAIAENPMVAEILISCPSIDPNLQGFTLSPNSWAGGFSQSSLSPVMVAIMCDNTILLRPLLEKRNIYLTAISSDNETVLDLMCSGGRKLHDPREHSSNSNLIIHAIYMACSVREKEAAIAANIPCFPAALYKLTADYAIEDLVGYSGVTRTPVFWKKLMTYGAIIQQQLVKQAEAEGLKGRVISLEHENAVLRKRVQELETLRSKMMELQSRVEALTGRLDAAPFSVPPLPLPFVRFSAPGSLASSVSASLSVTASSDPDMNMGSIKPARPAA